MGGDWDWDWKGARGLTIPHGYRSFFAVLRLADVSGAERDELPDPEDDLLRRLALPRDEGGIPSRGLVIGAQSLAPLSAVFAPVGTLLDIPPAAWVRDGGADTIWNPPPSCPVDGYLVIAGLPVLPMLRESDAEAWIGGWRARHAPTNLVSSTIAAETRLKNWLVGKMRDALYSPPGKPTIQNQARSAGHVFSGRAFTRAYAGAVIESGAVAWSAPGRKSKRRIKTPA